MREFRSFAARCSASTVALATALVIATPATAQDIAGTDAPSEAASEGSGEIVVTGTRIQRPGVVSNSPITAVDSQEIRFQGAVAVENVLNRMPQVTPDANENVSNGSDGTARINLRNLGSNRNLILINGQRMLPVQANNVNFIPSTLVDRIDVVTGGASAVYGSDAISGVVNFILKTDLDGIRADAQYGFSMHRNSNDYARGLVSSAGYPTARRSPIDGQKFDANIAAGKNFADGRGNISAYFGYRETSPILQSDRDVSACAVDPVFTGPDGAQVATGHICGGSSNNQYGMFQPVGGPQYNNSRDGTRTWVPYDNSFRYNTSPLNFYQRSGKRYTAGAFARFEGSEAAEFYGSFMYMDDHTYSQVAPSALWNGETFTVNCNNPFLSAQQGAILCGSRFGTSALQNTFIGYRPVAGNARPRRDSLRYKDYRLSGGLRGQIAEGIKYDVNVLHSIVKYSENYQNDIDPGRAKNALQVVDVAGTPTCLSVVNGTDPNCRPLDVFRYNGISDEAFDYIYVPTFTQGTDKETVYAGTLSADLTSYGVKSPWADNGIAIVLGAEHRRESRVFSADELATLKGTVSVAGRFNVSEVFTEISVPILEDKPFAKELTLNGGYRLSDYSNLDKKVSTYKVEFSYAPVADIRFRGSYNRAIRGANIDELYGPIQVGNIAAQDPCSGSSPSRTFAQCALTGVTQAQYGLIPECPSAQCSSQGGGNPALKPETADTYTAGVVIQPSFIPRLMLTADYFNIKVKDYIAQVPVSLIIDRCFPSGDPYFCGLFRRDPDTGILFGRNGYVRAGTQNTGSLATSGMDFGIDYSAPLDGIGRLAFSLIGTWLHDQRSEPLPGDRGYDCKGLFGPTCGQPQPEWRHQARLTYTDPSNVASVSLNWRYVGATRLSNNDEENFPGAQRYVINDRLPAYNYFDLSVMAKVDPRMTFRLGINNLFDKDPPLIAQGLLSNFGNGNTYPGTYDVAGRSVFIGFTGNF